jgi:hypothetical protein
MKKYSAWAKGTTSGKMVKIVSVAPSKKDFLQSLKDNGYAVRLGSVTLVKE